MSSALKNTGIVLLVIIVAWLGYLIFVKNPTTNQQNSTGNTAANNDTIDLSNRGLTQLDKNILDNTRATTLNVSHNQLSGSLPAEIRKLTNLETLDASNNTLTGIPAEIGQLSKLRTISFAHNDLSGLPLEIGNLANLKTLDLRGNPHISHHDINLIKQRSPDIVILVD